MCYVRPFFRQSSADGGVVRRLGLLQDADASRERVCECTADVNPRKFKENFTKRRTSISYHKRAAIL